MQRRIARKTIIALGLMRGLCLGQESVPDSAAYASFFGQVAQVKGRAPVFLNGQEAGMIQPSVQYSRGLTDTEAELLHNLAVACAARIRGVDEAAYPLVFEIRLRLIDSAEPMRARLRQRLNEIENRHDQAIRTCVDELRGGFGEQRFEIVREYVGTRKKGNFFPLISKPTTQRLGGLGTVNGLPSVVTCSASDRPA